MTANLRNRRRTTLRTRATIEPLERRDVLSLVALAPPADVSPSYQGRQTAGQDRYVAQAADGHYVAVWNDGGIKARLFNGDGSARSAAFTIGNSPTGDSSPTVAMNASGAFVVAWAHAFTPTDTDLVAEVFQPDGTAKTRVVTVANSFLNETSPSAGIDAAGDFSVAYTQQTTPTNADVEMIRFDSTGTKRGPLVAVGASSRSEYAPSLAMNASGQTVVAYNVAYSATDQDIFESRYDASGVQVDGQRGVATSGRKELSPSAAINAGGDFAIGYTLVTSETTIPGSGFFGPTIDYKSDVVAAEYSAAGTFERTVAVANDAVKDEFDPSIALTSDGRLEAAFTSGGQFDPSTWYPATSPGDVPMVRLRTFNASGSAINETTVGLAWQNNARNATRPSLSMGSDTAAVLLWESANSKPFGDLVNSGVFAQPLSDLPFTATVSMPGSWVPLTSGMSTSFSVSVARDPGYTGPVNIAVAGLPSGFTATVRPSLIAGIGSSLDRRIVTLTAPSTATADNFFNLTLQAGTGTSAPVNIPVPVSFTALTAREVVGAGGGPYAVTPQVGLPGTTVRVYGRGFSTGMRLEFPGGGVVPASNVGLDPSGNSWAEAPVPAGAISGAVKVINPAGVRATSTTSLIIGPQVFSVSSTWGNAPMETRPGTAVTIRGIGFAPGTTVTFGGVAAAPGDMTTSPDGATLTVQVPRLAVDGKLIIIPVGGAPIDRGQFTVYSFRGDNAFAFHNFKFNISTGQVMDAFGDQAVWFYAPFSGNRVPTAGALAFTAFAAAALNNSGACFGMSLTAERLIQNPGQIGTAPFTLTDLNGRRTVNNVANNGASFQYIEEQHLYQFSQEVVNYYLKWQIGNHTDAGVYDQIKAELQAGRHPIISMQEGLSKGHAVLAYDLEGTPDHFWIDVYDPNREFTSTERASADEHAQAEMGSRIEISPGNHWHFTMANGAAWEGGFGTLMVLPTNIIPQHPTMPSAFGTFAGIVFGGVSSKDSTEVAPSATPVDVALQSLAADPFIAKHHQRRAATQLRLSLHLQSPSLESHSPIATGLQRGMKPR